MKKSWFCNECGAEEYSGAVSEDDIEQLGCGNCGGWDFTFRTATTDSEQNAERMAA